MEKTVAGSHAISSVAVVLIAGCMVAVAPRLFAEITLVSRVSEARAWAQSNFQTDSPPAQMQTDFLPANLSNSAHVANEGGVADAQSTSNSSIVTNNPMGTLRVTGDGTASASGSSQNAKANATAQLIVLNFTLTNTSYSYSMTGQLTGPGGCAFETCAMATAKLTSGSGTIFEVVGTTLSETGTLPPGTYTLSVDSFASAFFSNRQSNANFNFALDPMSTPTPTPRVNISGNISDCWNPVPGPVPNVILTLIGSASGPTQSDASGNYQFSSLASGGNYTVTPNKAAKLPGSTGINTVDVIATQRHFLTIGTPLAGCRLTAADVNGGGGINTVDVIAIQRFFLGLSNGIANVGKYQFNPVNRTYSGIMSDQTNQNYDSLIFGDVSAPFVAP